MLQLSIKLRVLTNLNVTIIEVLASSDSFLTAPEGLLSFLFQKYQHLSMSNIFILLTHVLLKQTP